MKREYVTIPRYWIKVLEYFVFMAFLKDGNTLWSEDTARIKLPQPKYSSTVSVEKELFERRSVRSFKNEPLTIEEVSQLLWAAQGITNERGYRTAPSAGALYPLEIYIVAGNVNGLNEGVYRYIPDGHELMRIQTGDKRADLCNAALMQSFIRECPVSMVFSAVHKRITGKYGERGIRYAYIEVGHASQNIYLQAVSLNLGTVAVGAFVDSEVKKVIGMADGEYPLYIMPVGRK